MWMKGSWWGKGPAGWASFDGWFAVFGLEEADDGVVVFAADEALFAAGAGVVVDVVFYAGRELEAGADGGEVEVAGEVDPLAAVARPGLAAVSDGDAAGREFLFEGEKVVADHD